jgi:hypothetical protein
MSLARRFHLFLRVMPVILVLALLKTGVRALGFEFMPLGGLVPSLIGGSIFLIGFLLAQVLSDYREAERMPAELRTALEAIHDDIVHLSRSQPGVDATVFRHALAGIVEAFDEGLDVQHRHRDLSAAISKVDALSPLFSRLQDLGVSERYIVRLKGHQDTIRRLILRVAYIQKMEFIPSAHVLVQTLVVASLFVLLFVKTDGAWESMLILVLVGYMFVYCLMLIGHLDQPFRAGEGSVDDVSLFQLREFLAKLEAEGAADEGDATNVVIPLAIGPAAH